MAENTLDVRLLHAYKSESEWNSSNPILKLGETGYVSDADAPNYGRYKIGDGSTAWKSLPWGDKGIWDAYNGIEIGGRNLWLKTKEYDASAYTGWVDNNNGTRGQVATPYTTVNGFGVQRIAGAWGDISQRVPIEPNTVYTLSAWIKWEDASGNMYFFDNKSSQSSTWLSPQVGIDEYKRVSVTFNSGNATVSTCRFECNTDTPYLIYGLKLEKGNKATDWTPAPEDKADVSHTHSASEVTSGTLSTSLLPTIPVSKGGTGLTSITSGQVLIGNGTGNITTRAIDTTTGGTSGSTSLITSGAVYSGLAGKANTHDHPYLKLDGSSQMTGDLKFTGVPSLYWNDGTWQQRIAITDDSTADTAVFSFQQSSNSGSSFTDLMVIRDNGNVVANTFVGNLSGTATKANCPTGFNNIVSSQTWGNQNGTFVTDWRTSNSAEIAFRDNSGQLNVIIDGFYYQNEGRYKVLDENNYTSYTDSVYVKKSGDTMTGNISYNMYSSTQIPLKVYGGDASGQGISIGAGGSTIVGSGESAKWLESQIGETSEILTLASDSYIRFWTNCQDQNTSTAVTVYLDTARNFYPSINNSGAIGTSSYKWANSYVTTMTTQKILISGATNATMTYGSTNPQIIFSENGTQPVKLIYSDYDAYRAPAGLKVIGGTDATPAWFEVEGRIYSSGLTASDSVIFNSKNNQFSCYGGSWISGKYTVNVPIVFPSSSVTDGSRYDPYMWGQNINGDVWNFGAGADNKIGFLGFKASRTENGTDWRFCMDITSGNISSTGSVAIGSNLSVSGTTTLTGTTTHNSNIIINPGSLSNWNEGIRINKANNNWATLVMGGASGSTAGTGDSIWSLHANPSGNFIIAHNGSGDTSGLFMSKSDATIKYKGNVLLHSGNYSSYALPLSGGTLTGTLNATTIQGSGESNRLIFRHLDGQNCNNDYNLYLQYHTKAKTYFGGGTYYISGDGSSYNGNASTATQASLLKPNNGTTVGSSTWRGSITTGTVVWGESFKNTNISTDTGDISLWLSPSGSAATLNMSIDGNFYANGSNPVLNSSNYTSYTVTKTGSGASGTWGISVSGNAGTATKLATARTIALGGFSSGSASFDGSSNITINNHGYECHVYTTTNSTSAPYSRIAYSSTTGSYVDQSMILLVTSNCVGQGFGILKVDLRSNNITGTSGWGSGEIKWLVRQGFAEDQFILKGYQAANNVYFDLYFKATGTYNGITCRMLTGGTRGGIGRVWTLENGASRANPDIRTYNLSYNATDAGYVYRAKRISDSYNGNEISITYGKSGQSSTSWLASWNGYELGAISPANITAGNATNADKVDGYHAASLWRSDGATWNSNANVTCSGTGEWSFDVTDTNSTPGAAYWHVWSGNTGSSILSCYPANRHVFVPVHLAVGGYNHTSYSLSTNSFICNSWVRTVGSTGWYSETYGGGWYMSDSSWIRTYGSKNIYQNAGVLRTDGTLQVGADGAYFNCNSSGTTISTTLVLSKTTDASGSADNGPALVVGGTRAQAHIEIDNNEIIAKSNATTVGSLYLNEAGGNVVVNGPLCVKTTSYGTSLPSTGVTGQIFFKVI